MELPNHAKHLLLQLNQQRAKGFLCDVIIVVENALFRAHKNILAASSIYFKSLVLHDNLINLDTEMVNPSVFRQVLDFIYTGKLLSSSDQSSEQNFSALLTAASYLQLHDLAALCRKKLKRSGGKPLPGKPSTPGPLSRLRLNNQRLSSSTPAGPNNHYPPTPSDADQPQPDEGLRDKLSDDEMFVGSSGKNGNGGNGSSNGNLSSGGSAGEPDLGLDLSKKSPPSAGTATDALSPHSNSQESPQSASVSTTNSASLDDSSTTLPGVDTCGSETMELNSSSKTSEETQNQPDGPPPQKKSRQGARKNEWPKREASGLKSEDLDRPLVNGVIVGPKDGRSSGVGGGSGSSFTSDQSFQCKDEEEGGENGQDHSDESGQSDGESAGGGGGTGGGHHSANYVYRQEGFEPAFGDNLYVCIPCGKGFPSSEQLNAHVETHTEDELYIKEEGGTFVKEEDEEEAEDLSAPVGPSNFGSETRPFKCTVCSKSYKDPATLRQHEKSHWLTRPFPCNICGKMFTQRGTMTRHMRSHLGLKPFACEECGMRFTRQYRLTEHMRVHSGEKPYECQLCGGKFTQQRNLISHLRMHTSPS
ncbi:hypermethylated in cancer 2 protein [Lates japonicus]|uniref:Hypermethylated in cancer 1 protein n=1 Tax=Lates japonicus TaxID=270547 RepID=A0AAD3MGC6_LATJO|nr:hypermethylated in cancer 2 protein [Lates japonicus]